MAKRVETGGEMKGPAPNIDDLSALQRLGEWDGLTRLEGRLHDLRTRPNIFAIAPRILRVEGVHSDMLAWLLDPKGWHGLADRFATSLIRFVLADCGDEVGALEIQSVETEASTGRGPIDILVSGRRGRLPFVLGLENKVDASESPSQLRRYSEGLLSRYPRTDVRVALLTRTGLRPNDTPCCPHAAVSHRDIVRLLAETLTTSSPSAAAAVGHQLADHYLHALRSFVMSESDPLIDALCRELYVTHGQAWRAIRNRLPSQRDELHNALGTLTCQRLTDVFGGEWRFSLKRDRYARVYRPSWRAFGQSKGDRILGLDDVPSFDASHSSTHLRLAAELPEDDLSDRYNYAVKLRVSNGSEDDQLSLRTVRELSARDLKSERDDEFTIVLKSKSGLPSALNSSDAVLDWLVTVRKLRQAIEAVDAAVGSTA
jgi:hypothetical protein